MIEPIGFWQYVYYFCNLISSWDAIESSANHWMMMQESYYLNNHDNTIILEKRLRSWV